MINDPGWVSSMRIIILIAVPRHPAQIPIMKYSVPISLWLDEYSQRIGININMYIYKIKII